MFTIKHKSLCNLHTHTTSLALFYDASYQSECDSLHYSFAQSGQSKFINVWRIKFDFQASSLQWFCMVVMYNKVMTHDILSLWVSITEEHILINRWQKTFKYPKGGVTVGREFWCLSIFYFVENTEAGFQQCLIWNPR